MRQASENFQNRAAFMRCQPIDAEYYSTAVT